MDKQRTFSRTLLAMTIAALGASGTALAQEDVSGDFNKPQMLQVGAGGVVTVTSSINNPSTTSPDIDYYAFEGRDGESVTVDIDFAHDGTTTGLDTMLHLFSPAGVMVMPGFNTVPADSGSIPCRDPLGLETRAFSSRSQAQASGRSRSRRRLPC
jgi:hypothetical protein